MQMRLNLPYSRTTAILPCFARFGGWNGGGLALAGHNPSLGMGEIGAAGGGMRIREVDTDIIGKCHLILLIIT